MKAGWIVLALAMPACGLEEHWRDQCEKLGKALERPTKYDSTVSGGTCFIRCDYGWEDSEHGCGGNRKR